jgi:hypothetical protein
LPSTKINCQGSKANGKKKTIDVEAQERVAKGLKPQVVEVSVRGGLMGLVKEKMYGMTQ